MVDDSLLAALVGLGDEVDVAFVFDFGRARVLFAEDFAGFASGFKGDFKEIVRHEKNSLTFAEQASAELGLEQIL